MIDLLLNDTSNTLFSQQFIRMKNKTFTSDIWTTLFPVYTPSRWTRSVIELKPTNRPSIYFLSYRNNNGHIVAPSDHLMGPELPPTIKWIVTKAHFKKKLKSVAKFYAKRLVLTTAIAHLGLPIIRQVDEHYVQQECLESEIPTYLKLIKFGQCVVGHVQNNTLTFANGDIHIQVINEPIYKIPEVVRATILTNSIHFNSGNNTGNSKFMWVKLKCTSFKQDLIIRSNINSSKDQNLISKIPPIQSVYVCLEVISIGDEITPDMFTRRFSQLISFPAHGNNITTMPSFLLHVWRNNTLPECKTKLQPLFKQMFTDINSFCDKKFTLVQYRIENLFVDNSNNSITLYFTDFGKTVYLASQLPITCLNMTLHSVKKSVQNFSVKNNCTWIIDWFNEARDNFIRETYPQSAPFFENTTNRSDETADKKMFDENLNSPTTPENVNYFKDVLFFDTKTFKPKDPYTTEGKSQEVKYCCCKGIATNKITGKTGCGDAATLCLTQKEATNIKLVKERYYACGLVAHPDKNPTRQEIATEWFKHLKEAKVRSEQNTPENPTIIKNWSN